MLGHAYSLLEVADDVCGTGIDLVQLRNPWSGGEWKGARRLGRPLA